MGIEPTEPTVNDGSNGFEDRGRHQACRHFRWVLRPAKPRAGFQTLFEVADQAANDVPSFGSS